MTAISRILGATSSTLCLNIGIQSTSNEDKLLLFFFFLNIFNEGAVSPCDSKLIGHQPLEQQLAQVFRYIFVLLLSKEYSSGHCCNTFSVHLSMPNCTPWGRCPSVLLRHEVSLDTGRHKNSFFKLLYIVFYSCTVLDVFSPRVALIFSSQVAIVLTRETCVAWTI